MEFRILELFSGIGGMHYAFQYADLPGRVVAAMDINTIANAVYTHNHPDTLVMNNNVQKLSLKLIEKLQVNMILMSPPCQPHTRVGHRRDVNDHRSGALAHLCELLPQCPGVGYVLMENVKGFEESKARQEYVNALEKANFHIREFILSPTQFGVPNTRHRYYCLARKDMDFEFEGGRIWESFPRKIHNSEAPTISWLLEPEAAIPKDVHLDNKVLQKRVWLLDITTPSSTNTMCFTKAYTHYTEGTGSVFTNTQTEQLRRIFAELKELEEKTTTDRAEQNSAIQQQRVTLLESLRLRYFTPRELSRLMSFPESFAFPAETTSRQKYRLLGNSINVRVVGELIKLLCH